MGKKELRNCLGVGCGEKVMEENKKKRKIKVPKLPKRYGNPKTGRGSANRVSRGKGICSI